MRQNLVNKINILIISKLINNISHFYAYGNIFLTKIKQKRQNNRRTGKTFTYTKSHYQQHQIKHQNSHISTKHHKKNLLSSRTVSFSY